MRIDIAFITANGWAIKPDIVLDEGGEIQMLVDVDAATIPMRMVLIRRYLVVTAEPVLDPNLTARWVGEFPRSTNWQTLPRRWDHSQQGWDCEVRQHLP